jgi:hypothetical protein
VLPRQAQKASEQIAAPHDGHAALIGHLRTVVVDLIRNGVTQIIGLAGNITACGTG